jgi:hypothetical protein
LGAVQRDAALVARARRTAATVSRFSTMIINVFIAFLTLGGFGVVVLQEILKIYLYRPIKPIRNRIRS